LLSAVEQRLKIAERLAACLEDRRDPERVRHELAEMIRYRALFVKSLPTTTPISRSIATPLGLVQVCPGSEQEGPARSGVTATGPTEWSAGGACLPTGASRGGTAVQVRFLKRQLSLPVSTMSQ
jgi:hypothetical protein